MSTLKKQRLKYTSNDLKAAIASNFDSVAAGKMYNIPSSTIRLHREQPLLGYKSTGGAYLLSNEEAHLVSSLQLLPEYGFECTTELILNFAHDYMKSLDHTLTPGRKWFNYFTERN
ncbi:unnamed protein product [Didymodactylos carnosus]|uniref:HTH psq-type domain-containing protein n=1 Tax=Didymodactylos carnosus TaxID=1234261 RepID=A0A814XEM9_9BILA|nr:unnamed protein product [Didymodactylos carnosus]CAF1214709.1 unnamed protein product [Didymodactylos carnosus]CAF3533003.1 unnamed protein product [Didymodactylos carnosus]CAF3978610.1 unnamed protein product [Didymodactylos carnosus]